ncbi:hypothetical protein BD560DRAFT_377975 [Blakeslea trispora]|nr:hypothetical protein BD560DRAFT_377975 [Blakeslea trispora]
MIDTLLNSRSKRNSQSASIAALSINILPEFGWSIGNKKFFGPGTVFQGYVKVSCKENISKAASLRLIFTGGESLLAYDVGPDLMHSQSNQLFGISSTLWKRNEGDSILQTGKTYKFKFIIQMPLIQFPPSMIHNLYKCTYKLCACLDLLDSCSESSVITSANINYIPLLETKHLKSPIYLDGIKNRKQHKSRWMTIPSVRIKLNSVEYISGDAINATICIANPKAASSSAMTAPSFKFDYSITANLYQISHFHHSKRTTPPQLVGTQSYSLDLNESIHDEETQHSISLKLESYLPPSFDFGKIMSFSYKLRVKVYVKRARTSLSSAVSQQDSKKLKEAMVLPWPTSTMLIFETPIVIGTLGHGIRTGDELQTYTNLRGESNVLPVPKFIQHFEHEDELPKYEPIRLPEYEENAEDQAGAASVISSSASSITVV